MNSIPLIKGNTPQEINTSIIALKKALSELEAQDRLLQGTDKDVQNKIKQINELIEGINTHLGTVDTRLTTIDNQITALQPVDTVTSGNMHSVTSNAVFNINYQAVKYGANYDCNTMGEGVALINGEVLNSPYKQGLTTQWSAYLFTRKIASNSGYQSQIAISYKDNELFTRTYTDLGWTSWRRITSLKEKQIRIDDTSGYSLENGIYVKTISSFFTNNGIDYSKVVNIRQVNNGNNLYPYFFICYGGSDILKVFKFADINNTYVDIKVYYE